ncbi:hypothetical protein GCM10027051_00590 [Niabella terrae]
MKLVSIAFVLATAILVACNGSGDKNVTAGSFCSDTSCMTEPLRFDSDAPGKPYVLVSFKDCEIDSIHWEKGGMGVIKDIIFKDFVENQVKPSAKNFSCDIIDGKYAWMKFNDCATGRGYLLRLPFDQGGTTSRYTSAINNFDPKFNLEDGLVAYYDNTFIYVQDMQTDKVAKQLLTDTGVTDIDYNNIHSLIDSVNITKSNIYAKLKVGGKELVHNNPLEFK